FLIPPFCISYIYLNFFHTLPLVPHHLLYIPILFIFNFLLLHTHTQPHICLCTCEVVLRSTSLSMNLPPGFRFFPTDEELVVYFLQRKASLLPCHPDVIPDLDLYPYDPWDLPGKALGEGRQWYFYSRKTQQRVTSNGYWGSMEIDEPIFTSSTHKKVGIKKYFTFYLGNSKTNWIMQEYSLPDSSSSSKRSSKRSGRGSTSSSHKTDYSKWVICRVYEQNCSEEEDDDGPELSCLDEVFLSLDDLDEVSLP
ncbi:unnamed protein product, partial [Brassica oleracea]